MLNREPKRSLGTERRVGAGAMLGYQSGLCVKKIQGIGVPKAISAGGCWFKVSYGALWVCTHVDI